MAVLPWRTASTVATKIVMKNDRQKTISQGSGTETLRTRMPPRLQQKAAPNISSTPWRRFVVLGEEA